MSQTRHPSGGSLQHPAPPPAQRRIPGAEMTDSGAAHRVSGSGILSRVTARARSREDWARIGLHVRGPLLTLALAIVFNEMVQRDIPFAHPFPFLLLTVV